ncbi:MAG: cyanophycinase [Nocardioidaceae bacterium]
MAPAKLSPAYPASTAGVVMAIGGAEAKVGERTVLSTFVRFSGGADARIAVVPTASSLGPEVIEVYRAVFTRLGAGEVFAVRPETRADADDPAIAAKLDDATGVFLTGGNQLKLSAVVAGTRFGDALHSAHRRGVVVGGTSAGASILSSHMVAFGSGGATPKQRMSQLAAGLGLIDGCVIDQHFAQRNRYGRLLSLIAQSPSLLGIGVDEDTAAVIHPDGVLEVVGRGSVTVLDGHQVVSNAHEAKRTAPLLVSGAIVHVLPAGSCLSIPDRTLVHRPGEPDAAEVEQIEEASADLRQLAEDIAADGVSPTYLTRRRKRRTTEREHRMVAREDS